MKFATIWTVASLVPTVVVLLIGDPFWADWILDARGRATEGDVIFEEVLPNDSHDGGSSIIDIRVRFHDARGRAFVVDKYYVAGTLIQNPDTKRVQVEYDPDDPSVNRLKGGSASLIGYWAFFPMSFLLEGLLLLALALYMGRAPRTR